MDYLDPGEFPEEPRLLGESVRLEESIRSSIIEAFGSISDAEERFTLQGVYLDVSDDASHYVVATDGRHLYSSNSFRLPVKSSVILPDRTKFLRWKPFAEDGEWRLLWQPEEPNNQGWARLTSRRWTYHVRHIDGRYPNWRQVVPESSACRTSVDLDHEAIERLRELIPRLPVQNQEHDALTLMVDRNRLLIRTRAPGDTQNADFPIPGVKISGRPIAISLSRNYLRNAIQLELNRIEFMDDQSPILFSNGGRRMIIMPYRLAHDTSSTPSAEASAAPASSEEPATLPETESEPPTPPEEPLAPATPEHPTEPSPVSALDQAALSFEKLKEHLQEALSRLRETSAFLKQVQREQKTVTKEVQAFRNRLRELQSVKI